jgi:E-phenylitaconyl-CoA hydratase
MLIETSTSNGVATITLNRPEKHNSLTREMRDQLQAAWAALSADDDVRAIVITGAGDRAFCTGNDLSATPPGDAPFAVEAFGGGGGDSLLKGLDPDLPVIAAVNGYAIGGGMEIALACDIRIASANAEFALTEAKVGSIPGAGGTQLLPRLIARSLAMQMLLTGERITADRALAAGLVSEVTDGDVLSRAVTVAEQIAGNAPLSVRAIKRLVRLGDDAPLSTALQFERYAFGLLRSTHDRNEGRTAFTERRPPNYQGR